MKFDENLQNLTPVCDENLDKISTKSGFVSLIGRTNSGKSTLLNFLVGQKLAMVSHKANATRRKISGIVMYKNNQIIFNDTPGLHESAKKMNLLMVDEAKKMMSDCDLVLFLAQIFDPLENYENFLKIKDKKPHILLLTQCDRAKNEQILSKISEYNKFNDTFLSLIPVSAKISSCKAQILDEICKFLPYANYYFDPENLSTNSQKEIIRDFILEAVFSNLNDEIPYDTDVKIENFSQNSQISTILATIYTAKSSHKSIIIGKNGETIKRIGINARKIIADFLGQKTSLNLNVIAKKNWNRDIDYLKKTI